MLKFSFSASLFKDAQLATSLTGLSASFAAFGASISKVMGIIFSFSLLPITVPLIALIAILGSVFVGWSRYNKKLKEVIQKNEALSGSLEVILDSTTSYSKILERSGQQTSQYIQVKERLLKTFENTGRALKGYSELQKDLTTKLKEETLTIRESLGIWADKANLFKDKIIGNVTNLSEAERELKERVEEASLVLKDENVSIETQKEAVEGLANVIRGDLIEAYSDQATAAYDLWQRHQLLINSWETFKKIASFAPIPVFKLFGFAIDTMTNKLTDVSGIATKLARDFAGVGNSLAYLQRQAKEGTKGAQEALDQLTNSANATAKLLMANINPLDLTIESIQKMSDSFEGEMIPAEIELITIALTKMKETAQDTVQNFKEVFGKNLSEEGKESLNSILSILETSKNKVKDLVDLFKDLSKEKDFRGIVGSLESLEAGLQSGKIESQELKDLFEKLFNSLPIGEWEAFISQIQKEMISLGENSEVLGRAFGSVLTLAFKKLGLEADMILTKFQEMNIIFNVIKNSGVASTEDLITSLKSLGKTVKTASDFDTYMEAMNALRNSNKLSKADLLELGKITERTFKKIRSSASDLKDKLKDDFRLFNIAEQKAIAEEWKSYVNSTNTDTAITEKEHSKNLQGIKLASLKKRMEYTSAYYDTLKTIYGVDLLTYTAAQTEKIKADLAYWKAKALFDKLDTPGKEEKLKSKINKKVYEVALQQQIDAAKTLEAELKASYESRSITIDQFYKKQRANASKNTLEQIALIEKRKKAVEKEYTDRAALENTKKKSDAILARAKLLDLDLQEEVNSANEKGAQILTKLTVEEIRAQRALKDKTDRILESQLKRTEESRAELPGASEESIYQIKLDQLKRYHQDKYDELVDDGAKTLALLKQQALAEEELDNMKIAREQEVYDIRLADNASFSNDMANMTKDLMAAGLIQSKKAFGVYKAFAISETVISTYAAAQKAYRDATNPFLGAVAAAATIASGMARVAAIRSETPAFAEGGLVRGPGGPKDDLINARLSNREFVEPEKAVRHYGVGVMEGIRNLSFPKEMFTGFKKKSSPAAQMTNRLADGGQASSIGGSINSGSNIEINLQNNGAPLSVEAKTSRKDKEKEVIDIVLSYSSQNKMNFKNNLKSMLLGRS
ncbi:hypothetical protein DRO30_01370 [Candidatus Bathyarchaeota archaeon]|nr:MAG: hypothetical protein DRO30_01370 [Candidatus Bathyarchaeota archaeon]